MFGASNETTVEAFKKLDDAVNMLFKESKSDKSQDYLDGYRDSLLDVKNEIRKRTGEKPQ